MKFFGKKPKGPNEKVRVFPRDGMDIGFVIKGVVDYAPFFALCPQPKPPRLRLPNNQFRDDIENPEFKTQINAWAENQGRWMLIQSIKDTPGLEFEMIDPGKPETWVNLEEELAASGLTMIERQQLMIDIHEVNGLSEDKMQEARMRFLAIVEDYRNGQSSQLDGQKNISSGGVANVGELSLLDMKKTSVGTT